MVQDYDTMMAEEYREMGIPEGVTFVIDDRTDSLSPERRAEIRKMITPELESKARRSLIDAGLLKVEQG